MGWMLGIVAFIIISLIVLYRCEENKIYTDEDLLLKRVENATDNTYYFQISLSFFQYKKKEALRKLYGQNSIIYCKDDDSYHRVLKWGANVQGIQRIIAEPYIVEEVVSNSNYTLYISNNESVYINVQETHYLDELYKEITNFSNFDDEHEKSNALNTLKEVKECRVVRKSSLDKLCDFLEKYDTLFSAATNVLSIISSIIGMMK